MEMMEALGLAENDPRSAAEYIVSLQEKIAALRPPPSYKQYIHSTEWYERRDRALDAALHRCRICNSPDNLLVHHRTYERFGAEGDEDLTVLCDGCHEAFHRIRRLWHENDQNRELGWR